MTPMNNRIALQGEERIAWSKLRNKAASAVRRSVVNGNLPNLKEKEVKCVLCSRRAQVYHHDDYAKPLDVIPVCSGCNVHRLGTNAPTVPSNKKSCPTCGSNNTYARIDGSKVCRKCGVVWNGRKS